jgi:hypothetical protein
MMTEYATMGSGYQGMVKGLGKSGSRNRKINTPITVTNEFSASNAPENTMICSKLEVTMSSSVSEI